MTAEKELYAAPASGTPGGEHTALCAQAWSQSSRRENVQEKDRGQLLPESPRGEAGNSRQELRGAGQELPWHSNSTGLPSTQFSLEMGDRKILKTSSTSPCMPHLSLLPEDCKLFLGTCCCWWPSCSPYWLQSYVTRAVRMALQILSTLMPVCHMPICRLLACWIGHSRAMWTGCWNVFKDAFAML